MVAEIWVNIVSDSGLLPNGTKPLPEPMLTDHLWSLVTFILGKFHKRCLSHQSLKSILKFHSNFPSANELILLAKTSAHLYSKHSWYSMTHNHAISLGYTVLKFLNALDVLIPNRLVWIQICITKHTAWYIAHLYLLLFDICIWFLLFYNMSYRGSSVIL